MAGHELPGVLGLEQMQLRRAACVVALPCCGLWAASGGSVWRQGVCVQALPQAGLPHPAAAGRRPGHQQGGQNPQAAGLGRWHFEPARRQTQGDALADVRALAGSARCSHQSGAGGDGGKVGNHAGQAGRVERGVYFSLRNKTIPAHAYRR